MSKALAHPTLFALTGLLFAAATFFNMTASSSDVTTATALVSPAHATPIRASVSDAPSADKSAVVTAGKF